MTAQSTATTPATTVPASSSIEVEVLLLGSAGVWAKGPTLDAAFANAKKFGSLGKEVIIRVAPAGAKLNVDENGSVCFYGNLPRRVLPPTGGKRVWPNRRTPAMRAAVDEAVASITADDVLAAVEHDAADAAAHAAHAAAVAAGIPDADAAAAHAADAARAAARATASKGV